MATKKIIFLGDHGANVQTGATTAVKNVAGQVDTENPDVIIIGGDTYNQLSSTLPYNQGLFAAAHTNITKAKTTWTPGNHDNGGSPPASGDGDWSIAESYLGAGSLLRTNRNAAIGNTYFTSSISNPAFTNNTFFNTDQYIDVTAGTDTWRIIIVNSGARLFGASNPGWPGPEDGNNPRPFPTQAQITANTADEASRVNWLRSAWRPDGRNILITHHERMSAVGSHFDIKRMDWLWRECFGANTGGDGILHSQLYISGHDHNHQIFKPHTVAASPGVFAAAGAGVVHIVCGKTGEGTDSGASGSGNTNASDLQFGNTSSSADGYLMIVLDDANHTATCSLRGTTGTLLSNTAIASSGTQPSGAASVTITITGSSTNHPLTLTALSGAGSASTSPHKGVKNTQTLTPASASGTATIAAVKHTAVNTPQSLGPVTSSALASMLPVKSGGVNFPKSMTASGHGAASVGAVKHTGRFVNLSATIGSSTPQTILMDSSAATASGASSVNVVPSSAVGAGDMMAVAVTVVGANIGAGGATVTDTFSRTVAGGLGTADSGQAWAIDQAPASQYAVNGSSAVVTAVQGTAPIAHIPASMTDCEAVARFQITTPSTSFGVLQAFGLALRLTDSQNYFRAIVECPAGGGSNLKVQRQVANVNTDIVASTPIGIQPFGTFYWMRFRISGYPSTVQVKIWQDGAAEPPNFQYVATDGAAAGNTSGAPGFRLQWVAGATVGSSSILIDNYQVFDVTATGVTAPAGWPLRASTGDGAKVWTGLYTKLAGVNEAQNTYVWSADGGAGTSAALFDGTQKQRIEVANNAHGLDVNHFTIAAWVNPDFSVDTDPVHQRYEIMEKAGSFWFNIREDTTPRFLLRVGGFFNGVATDTFVGNTPIVPNVWTHVAATYDGASLRTYINGSLDQTMAQTGTTSIGAAITGVDENLVVGAKHRKGTPSELAEAFFNGRMDDFQVYNTALTAAQIQQIINAGGVALPGNPALVYDFAAGDLSSTTATDVSGNGNDGTLHGFGATPPTSAGPPGIQGKALAFSQASQQYIEAPDSATVDTTSTWTIDAWVNPTLAGAVSDRWAIVSKGHCWELQIRTGLGSDGVANTNHARIGCFFGGNLVANWDTVDSPAVIPANTWTHLAGRYDGSHVALFVNGVNVAQVAETRPPNIDTEPVHIGMHQQALPNAEGPAGFFDGKIQLPHVYSRALSDAEVAALASPSLSGQIVEFDFKGVNGSTVPDVSGSGENGAGQQGAVGAAATWNVPTTNGHISGGSTTGVFATMVSGANIDSSTPVRSFGVVSSAGATAQVQPGVVVPAAQAGDEIILVGVSDTGPRPWSDTGCALGIMPNPTAWSTQADGGGAAGDANVGMATLEGIALRKFAFAHSMVPWDCSAGATGNFNNASYAPTEDYNHNRLTYMSWPRPRTAPGGNDWTSIFSSGKARPGGGTYTGDPLLCFQDIAAGLYNTLIDGNAAAFAAYGHPIFCRLFWEFNGGGLAWGIGKSGTQTTAFATAFVNAWKLIVNRTRAIAPNVLFHWNPQNFATVPAVPRSAYWPGAAFVDSAGTEGYMSPNDTFITVETDGQNDTDGRGTYADYGPSGTVAANTVMGNGEGGNRWQSGGTDDTAAANRTTSLKNNIATYPAWKNYIWWNGNGSNGNSRIEQQPGVCQTAFQAMANTTYMKQPFTSTWKPTPAGWVKLSEDRNKLGDVTSQTNFGLGQCGQVVLHQSATASGDFSTPALTTWGLGHYNVVGFAFKPSSTGSGGVTGSISTQIVGGVTTWVDTGFETGVATDGGWTSLI